MENLINTILTTYQDLNIVAILTTGSQLFIENPKDYDIEVVVKNYPKKYTTTKITIADKLYDVSFKDEDFLLNNFNFPKINPMIVFGDKCLYNYFYNFCINIYTEKNYRWDMLNKREQYINYIKEAYTHTLGKARTRNIITKSWVHYYIVLKIYDNNKVEINQDMLKDIEILYNKPKEAESIIQWIESKLYT